MINKSIEVINMTDISLSKGSFIKTKVKKRRRIGNYFQRLIFHSSNKLKSINDVMLLLQIANN